MCSDLKKEVSDNIEERILGSKYKSQLSTVIPENFKKLIEIYEKGKVKDTESLELKFQFSNTFTPQVLWHQNTRNIYIKIEVSNVEKFKCDCGFSNFLFRY